MEIKSRVKKTFEKLLNSKFFKLSNRINNKTKGQEFILNYLNEKKGDVSAGELATALNVSTARIAVLLKKLIKQNYVTKYNAPHDARIVMISITETGRKYIEKENNGILEFIGRLIDKVGVDKIEDFIKQADEILLAVEPLGLSK